MAAPLARTIISPGARVYLALSLFCAALFLPGLSSLPPIDRDEARFMQASKQMVESGDYSRIRLQDAPRDKKPPAAYWLQAASANLFAPGALTATWPYRLPSVFGALLAVIATAAAARRLPNPAIAQTAGAVLATMAVVVVESHLAKADALHLALAAICFGALLLAYIGRASSAVTFGFWLSLGASLLVKGPVVAAACLLTIAALAIADRDARWLWRLQPILGIPTAMVVAGLWVPVAGMEEVTRAVRASVAEDLFPKLISGVEGHGAPPGSHLLAASFTLWPWGAVVPVAAVLAWTNRHRGEIRFCLAWIVPFWVVCEIVPTKLPHYILPVLPALAVLIADALHRPADTAADHAWLRGLGWIAATALPVTLVLGLWIAHGEQHIPMSLAFMAALVPPLLVACWSFYRASLWRHATAIAILAIVTYGLLLGAVLPGSRVLGLSMALRAAVRQIDANATTVALVGYHEPSAVFLLGTDTLLTDAEGAAAFVHAKPSNIAAINANDLPAAADASRAAGKKLLRRAEISGYNYAKGSPVTLYLVQAAP